MNIYVTYGRFETVYDMVCMEDGGVLALIKVSSIHVPMELCKLFFTWWRHHLSVSSFEHKYLSFFTIIYIYTYCINVHFAVRTINIYFNPTNKLYQSCVYTVQVK